MDHALHDAGTTVLLLSAEVQELRNSSGVRVSRVDWLANLCGRWVDDCSLLLQTTGGVEVGALPASTCR